MLSYSLIYRLRRFQKVYGFIHDLKDQLLTAGWKLFHTTAGYLLKNHPKLGPSAGVFSALALLREKNSSGIDGRVVLENQGNPPIPENSLMVLSGLRQHLEQPWPIFWSRHTNVRLVGPGLALVDQQKNICLEATYGLNRLRDDPGYKYVPLLPPLRLKGPWTSVISRWLPVNGKTNFCHWMLEALPRLAVLNEFPANTGVLVPSRLQPFQVETLRWLDLDHRCRPTPERHLEIQDFFFSSPPSMIVCYNPYAVEFLRAHFLRFASAGDAPFTRFYIHREGALRNAANETELLSFFRSLGWGIVDPARLSMAEQIRLFSQAEMICGVHGAAYTNLIWARRGCIAIEFVADTYLNGCFEWLSHTVGVQHHYFLFPSDHSYNAIVDLALVKKLICSVRSGRGPI